MSVVGVGAQTGGDPSAEVKGLIQDMLAGLRAEAGADATKKVYCDKVLAKTAAAKPEDVAASFAQQPAMPGQLSQAEGSATSIIGILEVVETHFATDLAKVETEKRKDPEERSAYDGSLPEPSAIVTVHAWKGEILAAFWWCIEQMLTIPDADEKSAIDGSLLEPSSSLLDSNASCRQCRRKAGSP